MRRFIGEWWFTQGKDPATLAMVIVEDVDTKERKALIGTGLSTHPLNVHSPREDAIEVKDRGAKVSARELREILDVLEGRKQMASCLFESGETL